MNIKTMARIESLVGDGGWWDCTLLHRHWRGQPPKIEALRSTVNELIASGRLETNGVSTRGRKFRLAETTGKSIVHVPQEVPLESPIVLAIYGDRVEMPLSSVSTLVERLS